jgi:hypothetical protein
MVRAGMRMCYSSHRLYPDLHPGNFIFMPDGRLGLIDFGCVRRYTAEEVEYLTEAERAGFLSREAIREAVIRGADLTAKQRNEKERIDLMVAWYDWVCEPVMSLEPFDFSQESYFRRGMELWRQLLQRRYVRSLPVNTWITKSFVGMRAMLFKLGAARPLWPHHAGRDERAAAAGPRGVTSSPTVTSGGWCGSIRIGPPSGSINIRLAGLAKTRRPRLPTRAEAFLVGLDKKICQCMLWGWWTCASSMIPHQPVWPWTPCAVGSSRNFARRHPRRHSPPAWDSRARR